MFIQSFSHFIVFLCQSLFFMFFHVLRVLFFRNTLFYIYEIFVLFLLTFHSIYWIRFALSLFLSVFLLYLLSFVSIRRSFEHCSCSFRKSRPVDSKRSLLQSVNSEPSGQTHHLPVCSLKARRFAFGSAFTFNFTVNSKPYPFILLCFFFQRTINKAAVRVCVFVCNCICV